MSLRNMLKMCLVFWKSVSRYAYKRFAYKKNMYLTSSDSCFILITMKRMPFLKLIVFFFRHVLLEVCLALDLLEHLQIVWIVTWRLGKNWLAHADSHTKTQVWIETYSVSHCKNVGQVWNTTNHISVTPVVFRYF